MSIALGFVSLLFIILSVGAIILYRRRYKSIDTEKPTETSRLLPDNTTIVTPFADSQQTSSQGSPVSQRLKNELEGVSVYKTRDLCSETVSERNWNWRAKKNDMVQIERK